MAVYYMDTSALVKRYARETGTDWVMSLADSAAQDLYTVRVTGPEMIAALFRKARMKEVPLEEARRAAYNFRQDWMFQYLILEVSAGVASQAMELAEKHGLRGYDAVHLAAALSLQQIRNTMELDPITFVSADDHQRKAAAAEGLLVDDANAHG
jgi:predicted nucleic acid-binding protein